MVGSVGGLVVARAFFFPSLTWADCFIAGIAGGIFGPLGDLCESMLKRAYQVKDSGKIIPGHGGLLDRIDALLFNAPMLYVYVTFVRPLIDGRG
jgi:phosphatidate cytidylyltransferase